MNISLILNKIKAENNFKTDSELADFFEISKSTLSNWRGRGTIDWELVLSKCMQMDFNWLMKENVEKNLESFKAAERKENGDISLNTILKRYEALAVENANLKIKNAEQEKRIAELENML